MSTRQPPSWTPPLGGKGGCCDRRNDAARLNPFLCLLPLPCALKNRQRIGCLLPPIHGVLRILIIYFFAASSHRSTAAAPAALMSLTPSMVRRTPSAARNTASVGIPPFRSDEVMPNAETSDPAQAPNRLRVCGAEKNRPRLRDTFEGEEPTGCIDWFVLPAAVQGGGLGEYSGRRKLSAPLGRSRATSSAANEVTCNNDHGNERPPDASYAGFAADVLHRDARDCVSRQTQGRRDATRRPASFVSSGPWLQHCNQLSLKQNCKLHNVPGISVLPPCSPSNVYPRRERGGEGAAVVDQTRGRQEAQQARRRTLDQDTHTYVPPSKRPASPPLASLLKESAGINLLVHILSFSADKDFLPASATYISWE